jgi:hypothetical protein
VPETASNPLQGDAGTQTQDGQGARARAQEIAGQARERAEEIADGAFGRAREQIDQTSTVAGEKMSGTASGLREMGEGLRRRGQHGPAQIVESAAERSERLASYLQESDADRILRDMKNSMRQQRWLVAVGAGLIGLIAARAVKSSGRGY